MGGSLVGLLALGGCTPTPTTDVRTPSAPASTPTDRTSDPPERAERDTSRAGSADSTVRLSFGGDVMFEDDLRSLLDDPGSGLAPVAPQLSAADFTMVNVEAAITTRGERDPKELEDAGNRYHFRSGPEVLTALGAAGVDLVSVANNHGADFGADGLSDTLAAQRDGDLPVVGVGRNRAEAFTPYEVTLQGQPFAFLAADASFLESTAPQWQAGVRTPGLAAARGPSRTALLTAVREAAAEGSSVIVYLHWGEENSVEVTAEQRSLATALSRAGATAVVGSHAHRLQAAGWLGQTYVAYGLGNFIWYHGIRGEQTGLLDLLVRDGRVVADCLRPAVIPREGGLPEFTAGAAAERATADWRDLRPGTGLAAAPPEPDRSSPSPAKPPPFVSSVEPITADLRRRMASSHRPGCPVPFEDLRYLRLSHVDFDGRVRQGELVVAAEHAAAMVEVFGKLYAAEFPIRRMKLVSDYGGDDDASMAANNTSGFNCRPVAGTDRWSQHSFGAAVDINPIQNPYVTDSVAPPAGREFARPEDRRAAVKGLVTEDSVVVRAFRDVDWEWGGDWQGSADYQHFSAAGS